MESHFKFLAHPIHPILVNLPIGSYIGSLIFDLVYIWRSDPLWYEMAFWLMGIGILGHVMAAGSGMVDFFALSKDKTAAAYRTARVHLLIGVVLLAVYLVNFYLRWSMGVPPHSPSRWPVLLSLIANGILGVQGWFGGELVYRPRGRGGEALTASGRSVKLINHYEHGRQTTPHQDLRVPSIIATSS